MASTTDISARTGTFANAGTKWGWFLFLGVVFIALGGIAAGNLFYATMVANFHVGTLMTLAGAVQLLHALRLRTWGGFFLWLVSGLLYAAAGTTAILNPRLVSIFLTFLIAALILLSGLVRVLLATRARPTKGWKWIFASGVVTTLAGFVFLIGWPVDSASSLDILLAVDLMFQGITLIGFACQLGTIP
jgi:uncharacterized membrane protein HdeD (DUF308 family)